MLQIQLDIRTIILLLASTNFIIIILALAYFKSNTESFQSIKYFLFARCFQSLAWILLFLRGHSPEILSINLANSLLLFGFAFDAFSFLKIMNQLSSQAYKYLLTLIFILVFLFNLITFVFNYPGIRVATFSLLSFLITIYPIVRLLFHVSNYSLLVRLILLINMIFLGSLVWRFIWGMNNLNFNLFTSNNNQALTFFSAFSLTLFGSFGFLLLSKENTDNKLIELASKDSLTGILNRRSFLEQIPSKIALSQRLKKPLSILMLDLDYFKKINDRYGHSAGDKVLIDFAHNVQNSIRPYDLFCRMGGEEFAVLLSHITSDATTIVTERIHKSLSESKILYDINPDFNYTVSIGCVCLIPSSESIDEIIHLADKALYLAKEQGRNQTHFLPKKID